MNQIVDKKSLDLDEFHRAQMRTITQKINDMDDKIKYCMKQISLMRNTIEWLVDERINKGNASSSQNSIERMVQQSVDRIRRSK